MPLLNNQAAMPRLPNQLAEAYQEQRFGGKTFTPPFPGNADIIPLTTYTMLCDEGRQQHNCVASYINAVIQGRSFIYRVLSPERCTLELAPRNGRWEAVQLRAACNRTPSEETRDAVNRWLAEEKKKLESTK